MTIKIVSNSPEETKRQGKKLSALLKKGDTIALVGDLGSGKTTLTKGIARGLGVKASEYVNSPSFMIINEYNGRLPLYHFDLYRLESKSAIESTGYEEYLYGEGVCVIEWAEKILDLLPKEYIKIEMALIDEKQRLIKFIPKGPRYKKLIEKIR